MTGPVEDAPPAEPAPPPEAARLPPHRVVARMCVLGLAGGLVMASLLMAVMPLMMLLLSGDARLARLPVMFVTTTAIGTAWCGLLVLGEELASLTPWRGWRRAVVPLAMALVLVFVVSAVAVWIKTLLSGGGMVSGLNEYVKILGEMARDPWETLGVAAALGAPFTTLAAARLHTRGDPVWVGSRGRSLQLVAALGGGAVTIVAVLLLDGFPSRVVELLGLIGATGAMTGGAALGLRLGERADARLLRWWAERKE